MDEGLNERRRAAARALLALLMALAGWGCGPESTATPAGGEAGSAAATPASETGPGDSGVSRVILISIDTLRADHVGCYGAEHAETPTLDRMAAEGARFVHAISPVAITLPSHATMLTGLDPPEHGARHNGYYRLDEDVPTLGSAFGAAGFATAGFVSAYVLDRRFGIGQGFAHFDDELGLRTIGHAGPTVPLRRADHTVDRFLAWMAEAPDRFFAFVHLYDPHADYAPPEPYKTRFAGRPYDGEIAFADAQVGRLIAAVEERFGGGTVVMVTSDHGEGFSEHGEQTHSLGVYDTTQRVPLLLTGPGVPRGVVVEGVVRLADIAPTLLELAGVASPLRPGAGRSVSGLLHGEPDEPRVAWVETLATEFDFGWSPLLGVRTAQHKYIRAPRPELYDVVADPDELVNLADDRPDTVRELDAQVEARSGGPVPAPGQALEAEARAQLEALGYVTEGAGAADAEKTVYGVVGGLDPKDEMHILETLHHATGLMAQRKYAEALAEFEKLGPRGYDISLAHGESAFAVGDLDRAEALVERAVAFAPKRGMPHVLAGKIATARGESAAARAAFELATRLEDGAGAAHLGLARLAESEGDREAARAHLERARSARTAPPESIWRLAAYDIEAGDAAGARARLAELPPGEIRQPPAALRLAEAEWQSGRIDLAKTRIAGALRAFPDQPVLRLVQGDLRAFEGDLAGAVDAFEQAARFAPDAEGARVRLAWALAESGRNPARAEKILAELVAANGETPDLLAIRARHALLAGDPARALAATGSALEQESPAEMRLWLLLLRTEALVALDRKDEARVTAAEARALDEGSVRPPMLRAARERVGALLPRTPDA